MELKRLLELRLPSSLGEGQCCYATHTEHKGHKQDRHTGVDVYELPKDVGSNYSTNPSHQEVDSIGRRPGNGRISLQAQVCGVC